MKNNYILNDIIQKVPDKTYNERLYPREFWIKEYERMKKQIQRKQRKEKLEKLWGEKH